MKTQIPLYFAIAGIGVVIGLLIHPSSTPTSQTNSTTDQPTAISASGTSNASPPPADIATRLDNLTSRLDQMQQSLKQETSSREDLQKKLSNLKQDVTLLATIKSTPSDSTGDKGQSTQASSNSKQSSQWFNTKALLDAGVEQSQADHIRSVYEDVEMKQLYLRDKAVREGWIGTKRYQKASANLDSKLDNLRNNLSDKEYDAYLYASGQPNRVVIVSALENSPASKAGIQAGDIVLSYDNKRVYNWSDLRQATTQGTPGDSVTVDLLHNGSPETVYVPRGPLGVQLDTQSVAP